MTIAEILEPFEQWAPPSLQEPYDNSGLILGDPKTKCTGVLLCLDVTEAIIDEAISLGYNLIISHHPLIFNGLKKIRTDHWADRTLVNAIRAGVAIYACHTNADNIFHGVNNRIADQLNLQNRRILSPKAGLLRKLVVFVPVEYEEKLRMALFDAGAGNVGNYAACSFSAKGMGTFMPEIGAQPFTGEIGKRHSAEESRLEVLFPNWLENKVLKAMRAAHPYEEIAYEIYPINNKHQEIGSGMIGTLPEPIHEKEWLDLVKTNFQAGVVRHTSFLGKKVSTVAVCGGSGSFLLSQAIGQKADVFLTADLKYHEFFEANQQILLTDIGHFESEQYTIDLFVDVLRQNFPTFAHLKTSNITNPIHYH
jgi:dinuclear metal center YbgI/SA1388 family protein